MPQVEIAAGARLPFRQQDIAWRGWAIECRIYAEDPANHFLPFPGTITRLARPFGPGIRVDDGIYEGWRVPMEYDPLLAKLVVSAGTRGDAIDEFFARQRLVEPPRELAAVAALAAALHNAMPDVEPTPDGATSPWVTIGRQELLR